MNIQTVIIYIQESHRLYNEVTLSILRHFIIYKSCFISCHSMCQHLRKLLLNVLVEIYLSYVLKNLISDHILICLGRKIMLNENKVLGRDFICSTFLISSYGGENYLLNILYKIKVIPFYRSNGH